MAAFGKVAPGDTPLHRTVLPGHNRAARGNNRLVRDIVHWTLPGEPVQFRGGRIALEYPGICLRLCPGNRPLSAIQVGAIASIAAVAKVAPSDWVNPQTVQVYFLASINRRVYREYRSIQSASR